MIPFIQSTFSKNPNLVTETWVFIAAGQSNMLPTTGATWDSNTDTFPEGTLQWGRFTPNINQLMGATIPLEHWGMDVTSGFGRGITMRFANRLKAQYPNVTIVFIPVADGGTGFQDNKWNKGDVNYEDMVARTNLCLSENPDFKLKGLLWHQGERDKDNSGTYQASLLQFNTDWRNDITQASETTPFVCGGLLPSFVSGDAGAAAINAILEDVPNLIPYSGFADASSPTVLTGIDTVHFDSDSSLILGDRYYDAYLRALNNN